MPEIDMTKVEALVEKTKQDWIKKNLKDIPKRVERVLDRHFSGHVARLLGMDNHWGGDKWELDHCNGRAGNSFLGEEIKAQIRDAVGPMVVEMVKGVKLTDKQVDAIKGEYRTQLAREVERAAMNHAAGVAGDIVDQITTGEYVPEPDPTPRAPKPKNDIFKD